MSTITRKRDSIRDIPALDSNQEAFFQEINWTFDDVKKCITLLPCLCELIPIYSLFYFFDSITSQERRQINIPYLKECSSKFIETRNGSCVQDILNISTILRRQFKPINICQKIFELKGDNLLRFVQYLNSLNRSNDLLQFTGLVGVLQEVSKITDFSLEDLAPYENNINRISDCATELRFAHIVQLMTDDTIDHIHNSNLSSTIVTRLLDLKVSDNAVTQCFIVLSQNQDIIERWNTLKPASLDTIMTNINQLDESILSCIIQEAYPLLECDIFLPKWFDVKDGIVTVTKPLRGTNMTQKCKWSHGKRNGWCTEYEGLTNKTFFMKDDECNGYCICREGTNVTGIMKYDGTDVYTQIQPRSTCWIGKRMVHDTECIKSFFIAGDGCKCFKSDDIIAPHIIADLKSEKGLGITCNLISLLNLANSNICTDCIRLHDDTLYNTTEDNLPLPPSLLHTERDCQNLVNFITNVSTQLNRMNRHNTMKCIPVQLSNISCPQKFSFDQEIHMIKSIAIQNCNFTSFTMTNISSIEFIDFKDCAEITSIVIEDKGGYRIKKVTIENCPKLKSVTIINCKVTGDLIITNAPLLREANIETDLTITTN